MDSLCTYALLLFLALSFVFSAHCLPFTHEIVSNKLRGGKQWTPGVLNERPRESAASAHGAAAPACVCHHERPPADMVERLKNELFSRPHPMFFLSEMAEKRHKERHCTFTDCGQRPISPESEQTIPGYVREVILGYLNSNTLPTIKEEPCPPLFNITFHPKRYPRYLVEVVCTENLIGPVIKNRECSYSPSGDAVPAESGSRKMVNSKKCHTYHLGNMPYLTQDLDDCPLTEVERRESDSWHQCLLPDVGVGCRCTVW